MENIRSGYCVYINTLLEGPVPSVRDGAGLPCVFATRHEAEREIADNTITRLMEFMEGQRNFDDAITVEEYIVEVDVLPDGKVVDELDNQFRARIGGD